MDAAAAPAAEPAPRAAVQPPTRPAPVKLVVAVDLDEVLGAFVEGLAAFHNKEYGTALTSADFHSYHFVDVWGGTPEETMAKVTAFMASPQFDALAPVAEAAAVLRAHSDAFRFAVVTSRQHVLEAKTRAWLDAHFPGVFDTVLFGNHYGEGEQRSKSQLCASIGAVALIDDSAAYAREAAGTVPTVILFGKYAWNKHPAEDRDDEDDGAVASEASAAASSAAATAAAAAAADPSKKWLAGAASRAPWPHNVVRAINWRHVGAILARLRPPPAPPAGTPTSTLDGSFSGGGGGGGAGGDGPRRPVDGSAGATPPQPAGVPSITHRDILVSERRSASFYADAARRALEVQCAVALSGAGPDTRLAVEAAGALVASGDATIASVRTGADAAPPGAPRPPRITIEVRRSRTFLARRFAAPMPRAERGAAAAAAAAAAASGGGGGGDAQQRAGWRRGGAHVLPAAAPPTDAAGDAAPTAADAPLAAVVAESESAALAAARDEVAASLSS